MGPPGLAHDNSSGRGGVSHLEIRCEVEDLALALPGGCLRWKSGCCQGPSTEDLSPGPRDGEEGNPHLETPALGASAPFLAHLTSLYAFCSRCLSYARVWLRMDHSGDFKFEFKSELKSGLISHVRQEANRLIALNLNVLICEINMGRKIILNFQGHGEDEKTTL